MMWTFTSYVSLLIILFQETQSETESPSKARYQKAKQETLLSVIPLDKLVNKTLEKQESHVFYLLDDERQAHSLSIIVIPCSGPVQWSIKHRVNHGIVNDTEILQNPEKDDSYQGSELHMWMKKSAEAGLYLISITSLLQKTQLQIFATMDPGGPYDLTIPQEANIRVLSLRRRRLLVRWEPSLINPHNITYCIVVSKRKWYTKLCEAERAIVESDGSDVKIECVKQKTHVSLKRMEKDVTYYVDLFTVNFRTGLPIHYGNISHTYNPHIEPILLRDGKPKSVNLRKYDGRISFRFRASVVSKDLHMYVLVCGGSAVAQVMNRGQIVSQVVKVQGYQKFVIYRPKKGEYYSIKVHVTDGDELGRMKHVEVFATQYPATRYPLPDSFLEEDVYEYIGLRNCTSVTVAWVPIRDPQTTRYCIFAREMLQNSAYRYISLSKIPDQCGLDKRRIKPPMTKPIFQKCSLTEPKNEKTIEEPSVNTYTVTNLQPGKNYQIQVTVKKFKGRTLSYNILYTNTKHTCD